MAVSINSRAMKPKGVLRADLEVADYAELRLYAGAASTLFVTGSGIAGTFVRDATVTVDNGGTEIVGVHGWRRVFDGAVDIRWFEAKGDGSTDDGARIQVANDYCEQAGLRLSFPAGNYVAKQKLLVSCPWHGVPRDTTITIPSDFVPSGGDATELNIAIKNKNFSTVYSEATADYVDIRSIDFVIAKALTNLRLGNVKGGYMEDCQFSTSTAALVGACFDIFVCVKDFTARHCSFSNGTQNAVGGGAVWVRNITTAGNDPANNTENVLFEDCKFVTTTLDEAVAVYGVRGKTRNVTFRGCTVEGAPSAVRHGTLASTFPLNDGFLISGVSYAAVEGVLWDDCTFIDGNFIDHVLRFGETADAGQAMSDIKARNCRFFISKSVAGTSYALRSIRCVGFGVTAENCHVTADGSSVAITSAFTGLDLVSGCTTSGNITNATDSCEVVADNPRLVGSSGAANCKKVCNNRIYATSTAVLCNATAEFAVGDNYIEAGAGGVIFNTLGGAVTPSGEATNNRIVMSNAASFALQASGTTGRLRANGNKISGTGKSISGSTWAEIQGNDWYGVLDSRRAAGFLDFDHNNATPIGTYTTATTHTLGTTRILLGFVKTANAGVGADWKSVFGEQANN
jgi:hypothetical protein